MSNYFPDNIVTALKEARHRRFWKKQGIVRAPTFREMRCGIWPIDWGAGLEQVQVSSWFHQSSIRLNTNPTGIGHFLDECSRKLLHTRTAIIFSGFQTVKSASVKLERSLEHLRLLVKDHDAAKQSAEEQKRARLRKVEEAQRGAHFKSKLSEIQKRFIAFCGNADHKKRGYGLEELLYDVFFLFRSESARRVQTRVGEQIDGAFVLAGDHYLLEAKWQAKPIDVSEICVISMVR